MCHASGAHAATLRGLRRATGEGIAGWVSVNGRPAANADPCSISGIAPRKGPPLRSCLAVPLFDGETFVAAVLALYRMQRAAFSENEVRLVELLAPAATSLATAAIERNTSSSPRRCRRSSSKALGVC